MNLEHEFQLALIKKQAAECRDTEVMRKLVLEACEMLQIQQRFVLEKIAEGWCSRPVASLDHEPALEERP
jgi:hypothetical protein